MKKFISLLLLLTLCACEGADPITHYQEIAIEPAATDPHAGMDMAAMRLPAQQQTNDPATAQMLQNSAVKTPLAWDVPTGWQALPGEGMRLVTFTSQGNHPITCTIVSLGGIAGGLEDNIGRWAKQINLDLQGQKLLDFIRQAQVIELPNGMTITVTDFSSLQEDAASESMIAAILSLEDISTIFIKMTGTKQAVLENKKSFLELCHSLRLNHE